MSRERPRTLLEQLAAAEHHTWPELTEQFLGHARELHRESGEPMASLSREHLQRIAAGKVNRPHPSTARVLQRQFARPIGELLGPPEPQHDPRQHVSVAEQVGQEIPSGELVHSRDTTPSAPSALYNLRDEAKAPPGDQNQAELLRRGLDDALTVGAMADASLDDWDRTVIRYGRATRDRPASVLLDDLTADLTELKKAIERHRSASALRRLIRVVAQMSGLMCLTLCKLDDRPAFRRWTRTARSAANEAGDAVTFSWVLAQEAYGHYYSGDLPEAIEVARNAQAIVSATPCVGSPLAAALEARAHASMGSHQEAREALARAEGTLSRLMGEDLFSSAFGYNEAQLRFHEGSAYTHLRDVRAGLKAQDRALELCAPGDYTDWAMIRLDRASCLVNSGRRG